MAIIGTVLGGVVLALGIYVSAAPVYSFGSAAESLSNPTRSRIARSRLAPGSERDRKERFAKGWRRQAD